MLLKLADDLQTVDIHNHLWGNKDMSLNVAEAEMLLNAADKLGIHRIGISNPDPVLEFVPSDVIRQRNKLVIEAMQFSDRFIGFCYLDPNNGEESVTEIERCVNLGMAGIKLYHQLKIQHEGQHFIMETAAKYGIPVLMHAGKCCDPDTLSRQPRLSNAADFMEALEKYPDTMFIQGHIGGGGDWQWNLRCLETVESDNYFIDISGSIVDADMVRDTVDAVGASRVLFATDMSMEEGVGKLMAARLSDKEMKMICSGNWERIAARRKR